jgi:hypothetical protein
MKISWFLRHCDQYDNKLDMKKGSVKIIGCKYRCYKNIYADDYIDYKYACNCTGKIVTSVKQAQKDCIRGVKFI